jgi:hypothetical protein
MLYADKTDSIPPVLATNTGLGPGTGSTLGLTTPGGSHTSKLVLPRAKAHRGRESSICSRLTDQVAKGCEAVG